MMMTDGQINGRLVIDIISSSNYVFLAHTIHAYLLRIFSTFTYYGHLARDGER